MFNDLKMVFNKKILIIAALVIAFVPAIYAVVFIGSMWDPYGNTNNLPVAVVNLDQDKNFNLGNKVVSNLKRNRDLDYSFTSKKAANHGLLSGKYAMVIEIPKDFSKNATSLLDSNPKKMKINYFLSSGKSYISSKISDSALEKIKNRVTSQVNQIYIKDVLSTIGKTGNNLQTASDGTNKIDTALIQTNNGALNLVEGSEQLNNASNEISKNSSQLAQAMDRLQNGQSTLANGLNQLNDGSNNFANSLNQLNEQLKIVSNQNPTLAQLSQQIDQLNSIYSNQLQPNINKSSVAANNIVQNTDDISSGARQLNQGLITFSSNIGSLNKGASSLQNGLTTIEKNQHQLGNSLSVGALKIKEINTTDKNINALVKPLKIDKKDLSKVPNNGTAMSPYMMSVALWVGAMVITTLFNPAKKNQMQSAKQLFISKISLIYPLSILQALIMYLLMQFTWGIKVINPVATIAILIVTSLVSVSIVSIFRVGLGSIGMLLSLIFMIFQLSASGGTYPLILSNIFYQKIHDYIPMSYSIDGLRKTISIGINPYKELIILSIILFVLVIVWYLLYKVTFKKEIRELIPID
ncbi:MAG: YhgE/Pip domain-containing protein [Lactobacillaceae bacterium]|jgi:putative membrane protein|nr:YhgE/Pip domain-containing protein [Lactobacillaceae bacterium]